VREERAGLPSQPNRVKSRSMDFGEAVGRAEGALFVGRASHLARLAELVRETEMEPRIVVAVGQGGAGKSALVRELLRRLPEQRAIWLSGERMAPNAEAFQTALGERNGGKGLEDLGRSSSVDLLVIDGYEKIKSIERWLFEDALTGAGARLCVLITSRESLSPALRATLGAVVRELVVPPLEDSEARDYLSRREVPEASHSEIVTYAAGHALALTLIADRFAIDPHYLFEPKAAHDLVASLVSELVRDAPSLDHESALYALAVPWALDEPLLTAMLDLPSTTARSLFRWLRSLAFVERGADGLVPHALVRTVLYDDLAQRNPERLRMMVKNASELLLERIALMDPLRAPYGLMCALYMRRKTSPLIDPLRFEHLAECYYRPVTEASMDALAAIVHRWEGAASAARFRTAVAHDPGFAFAVHSATAEPIALNVFVSIGTAPDELVRGDAVLERAHALWRELEPEGRWELAVARWRMTADGYQSLGPEMQAVLTGGPFITSLRAPNVRWVLFAASPPEAWEPLAKPFGLSIVGRIDSQEFTYTLALADTHRIVGGPCTASETAKRLTRVHLENLSGLGSISEPEDDSLTLRAVERSAAEERSFRREGDYWTLIHDGHVVRLKDSKGALYLACLLAQPRADIHVLELAGMAAGGHDPRERSISATEAAKLGLWPITGESSTTVLDLRARTAYRERLEQLEESLCTADELGDVEHRARAEAERSMIERELALAMGLRGRGRRAPAATERLRVNVTRTIKSVLRKILQVDPDLGRHLATSVRTGAFCTYSPDPGVRDDWDVSW
jgi:hypothetical protein